MMCFVLVLYRWYRIKITVRWEDSENINSFGIPARVVQYEGKFLFLFIYIFEHGTIVKY